MAELHFFDTAAQEWTPHPLFPAIRVKSLETRATHPHASMMVVQVDVGGVIEPHMHQIETETAYVLQGQAVLLTDRGETPLTVHTGISIPPGLTHSLRNTGDTVLELFAIHTPPVR